MKDFCGHDAPENEPMNKIIDVWEITPCLDPSYDYIRIRGYQDAVEYAKKVVEDLMDNPEIEFAIKITINKAKMELRDYLKTTEDK